MVELLKQKKYDIVNFEPFIECINELEKLEYTFISVKEEYDWIEEWYEGYDHSLEILTFKDKEKEWISIYKFHDQDERFEQIEFMIFNENYCKSYHQQDYNCVVYYAAHFEDEQYTRMVCSGYTYKDSKLIKGWRELRKFDVNDLDKVMYSKSMNLKELTIMADDKITEFCEVISLKKEEVKELKLEY